ncbi:MAG: GNAT family N-acetyltransferase [Desulfobacterota bacterium]|nr:GNAT family N-acetyltransferase [Thermodesulfobacteriota bacterium]
MKSLNKKETWQIGLLDERHLPAALALSDQSLWNQNEHDWRRLLQSSPGGCFGAFSDGRLVGTVTTVVYGTQLAWLGMMLVDPAYRRRGLGTRLMESALAHLKRSGVVAVKLDATPAGKPLYETLGFRAEGPVERWEGEGQRRGEVKWPAWEERLLPSLYGFDRLAFGADRSNLLASLIADSPLTPLVALDAQEGLEGFALARPGRQAYYIGPLAARSSATALALFDEMLGRLPGERIYLDFNATGGSGVEVLAERGLVKQRNLTQMALGPESPAGISPLLFGLAGPESG